MVIMMMIIIIVIIIINVMICRAMLDKLDGRVPAQDGQTPLPPVQDSTNGPQVRPSFATTITTITVIITIITVIITIIITNNITITTRHLETLWERCKNSA